MRPVATMLSTRAGLVISRTGSGLSRFGLGCPGNISAKAARPPNTRLRASPKRGCIVAPSRSRKRTRSGALPGLTTGTTSGAPSLTRIPPPTNRNISPSRIGPISG